MYHIQDYRQRAIEKVVPYLIEFPNIVSIIENSADRYQAIEDVLWRIADNFKVSDSRGVFLLAHANNEVVNINYTDNAEDAFMYADPNNQPSDYNPQYNAYGTGHYYSQSSYISGIRKTLTEDKTIRAVLSQIIQNNTNCTIEDLIESLKLLYNAEHVKVLESNPLRVNIELIGSNIELSSSGNYENIKKMLPACVYLSNIYVNPLTYDVFRYSSNSAYGISRYPVRVGDSTDIYQYVSNSITLNSINHEYIQRDIQTNSPDRATYDSTKISVGFSGGDAFETNTGFVNGGTAFTTSGGMDYLRGGSAFTPSATISSDGILTHDMVECPIYTDFSYTDGDSWEFTTKIKMRNYLGNNNTKVCGTWFFGSQFLGLYTHPSYNYSYFYARKDNGTLIKDFTSTTALYAGRTYYITYGWDKDSRRLYVKRSENGVDWDEESIIISASEMNGIGFVFRPTVLPESDVEWIDLKQTTFSVNGVELFNCNKDRSDFFTNNMYCYVTGKVVSNANGQVFVSCNDLENSRGFSFGINAGKLALKYNGVYYTTDITAEVNRDYSFMIAIANNVLKVWSIQDIRVAGNVLTNDISYITNVVFNKTPIISINNVEEIQGYIYINCEDTGNGLANYGNFTYHAIIFGNIDTVFNTCSCLEYYATCYGEKHILFNCLNNTDNLKIMTDSTLATDLVTHQSVFNYKYNHSCGRYMYLDGDSYIQYSTLNNNITCTVNSFDISFNMALPVSIDYGVILGDILGSGSEIGIYDNKLYIKYNSYTVEFGDLDIELYNSYNYRLVYNGSEISIYKNDTLIQTESVSGHTPSNLVKYLYIGSDNLGVNTINCILSNIKINIEYTQSGTVKIQNVSIPFTETLKDTTKEIGYTNYGARFISVPQLIANQDNTDIYGNTTIRYS